MASTNGETLKLNDDEARAVYDRIFGAYCVALASIEDRTFEIRNEKINPDRGYDTDAWHSVAVNYPNSQGLNYFNLKIVWNVVHEFAEGVKEDFELQLQQESSHEVTPFDDLAKYLESTDHTETEILEAISRAVKIVINDSDSYPDGIDEIVGIALEFGIEPVKVIEIYDEEYVKAEEK